jgi:hypothetical protein
MATSCEAAKYIRFIQHEPRSGELWIAGGEAKRTPRKTVEKKQGALEGRRTISSEVAPPGLLIKQDPVSGIPLRSTPG